MKNNFLKLMLLVTVVLMAGCLPKIEIERKTTCLRGVEYYRTAYRLAPAFKTDGTLYLCEEESK